MEKKTIGSFIAALRRANGMTQRQLAEQLNVSDKTVSRWERDDGAPDLSLIPVIAEIFGVTCDELLRGERNSPAERAEAPEDSPKGEKQRRRLLRSAWSKYQNLTYMAMGLSAVGVIAALIGNLAFLKAVLGFLMGTIFFVASVVCQIVFVNKAFLSVENDSLNEAAFFDYKRRVIDLAQKSIGLTVSCIGFTLPLAAAEAYTGIRAGSLFAFGAIGAAAASLLYAVTLYFLNASLLKKGVYRLPEKEAAVYHHNHKLKRICAIVWLVLFAVTFVGHQVATAIWGPHTIMEGIVFDDYESFAAYMEQSVPADPEYAADHQAAAPSREEPIGAETYYDEYGNEISREEALTRRLEDKNGNVVCEYVSRNEKVVSLQYTAKDGSVLPITVFTEENLRAAQQTAAVRHVIFGAVYGAEILVVLLIYFKKRAR